MAASSPSLRIDEDWDNNIEEIPMEELRYGSTPYED